MKLDELVDADDITKYIKFHATMNPSLWDDDRLRPEVRNKLLEISNEFVDFLEIDGLNVMDLIFTGSNAAFNYTSLSDIDLHLLVDMSSVAEEDIAENLFNAKRLLWNKVHDIDIYGYSVELYVEDITNPVNAAGIYSVSNNKWIKKPSPSEPPTDDISIVAKTNSYVDAIDSLFASDPDQVDVKRMINDVYALRKAGLENGGEFSTENLAFKSLRNLGYIDKLREAVLHLEDRRMSLRK